MMSVHVPLCAAPAVFAMVAASGVSPLASAADDQSAAPRSVETAALIESKASAPPPEAARGDDCEPQWVPMFGASPRANINDLIVFDDGAGDGEVLYVGGGLQSIAGVPVDHVARWDGTSWSAVGNPPLTTVHEMAAFDDASGDGLSLFVVGSAFSQGSPFAYRLAKWDGEAWTVIAQVDRPLRLLEVFDDGTGHGEELYMAGYFNSSTPGMPFSYIARWNGSEWREVGGGLSRWPEALSVYDDGQGGGPALYAAGDFSSAGGEPAMHFARWNGAEWEEVGGGLTPSDEWPNFAARSMVVHDDGSGSALYVGGFFAGAGDIAVSNIARWNGIVWDDVGGGVDAVVHGLATYPNGQDGGSVLVATGGFSQAGGVPVKRVAEWDGSMWRPLANGADSAGEMAVYDNGDGPLLYTAGHFRSHDVGFAPGLGIWDGEAWSPVAPGLNGRITDLAKATEPSSGEAILYFGGSFTSLDGEPLRGIARWDGESVTSPGGGVVDGGTFGLVHAVHTVPRADGGGHDLIIGGNFTQVGGTSVQHIARWDGAMWHAMGEGLGRLVNVLITFDDGSGSALYAGGLQPSDSPPHQGVLRWGGSTWSAVGSEGPSTAYAFTIFDDGSGPALFVGSSFSAIWKWDGSAWTAVAHGQGPIDKAVRHLAVFNDGTGNGPQLYAGGSFDLLGNWGAPYLAKWNGISWSRPGGGVNGAVGGMTIFDDGTGPALYVSGGFTTAGGTPANGLAKWDGNSWTAVQWNGESAGALGTFRKSDDEPWSLMVGVGEVSPTGDAYLARLQGCPTISVPGDLTGDGVVNVFDLLELLGQWGACIDPDDCPADLAPSGGGDGQVNVFDLLELLARWS